MKIFTNPNYNFIRWRWPALAISLVVIAAGVVAMVTRGVPLGIDFSGGTAVIVKFQQPVGDDVVQRALEALPGEKVVQRYGEEGSNEKLIRLKELGEEEGDKLELGAKRVVDTLQKANVGAFEVAGTEIVGAVVGRDLQRKGIYATLASIVGITIYIAIRFRLSFALGAIAATFHDIFVTLAFLIFFGYELSLNVVAALLTITGYSVNDTIVVFDRVRENLRSMRRDSLEEVVNRSVNQTLGRTIITAGTTFISVLALFVYGGDVLRGFAFTMLVGIVSGTYSTVFIASAIAIILSKRRAARAGGAATPAEPAARSRKRKARAS